MGMLKNYGYPLRLALAYGLWIYLLRLFAIPNCNLVAGVRLAVFLTAPVRRWPALIIGEWSALLCWTLAGSPAPNADPLWILYGTIMPVFGAAIPSCVARRAGLSITGDTGPTSMIMFMAVIAVSAAISARIGCLTVFSMHVTTVQIGMSYIKLFWLYSLGCHLGALSVVPAWIWIRHAMPGFVERRQIPVFVVSALSLCAFFYALTLPPSYGDSATTIRIAMFALVAAITLHWGWQGVSIAGPLSIIGLQCTQREPLGASLLGFQQVVVAAVVVSFVVGSKLSASYSKAAKQELERSRLADLARRQSALAERQLAGAASMLDAACAQLHTAEKEIRSSENKADALATWWQTIRMTRSGLRDLGEVLRPGMLETHGLRAALSAGPIGRSLTDVGIDFDLTLRGEASALGLGGQALLYRIASEAVAILLQDNEPRRIAMRLKASQRGAILLVKASGRRDYGMVPMSGFPSTGLCKDDLDAMVESHNGECREWRRGDNRGISIILRTAANARARKAHSALA